MKFKGWLFLVILAVNSCASWFAADEEHYDDRPLTIAVANLFSQLDRPRDLSFSWTGDWEFRRDRLALIDRDLRALRPDIVALQDMMERSGSRTDSDRAILRAASLNSYNWAKFDIAQLEELGETRSFAVATLKPIDVEVVTNEVIPMGSDGFMTTFKITGLPQPVLLFNVSLPLTSEDKSIWYPFLEEKIGKTIAIEKLCVERVIVAGSLPVDIELQKFQSFLKKLNLRDSSVGFCQVAERCATSTSQNDIFRAIHGDTNPLQTQRILVSQAAYIAGSSRILATPENSDSYNGKYKLDKLWPSAQFGWITKVKLPLCSAF